MYNQILISCRAFVLSITLEHWYFQTEEEVNPEDDDLEITVLLIKYRKTDQVLLNLNMMTGVWVFIFINPQVSIKICPLYFKRKRIHHVNQEYLVLRYVPVGLEGENGFLDKITIMTFQSHTKIIVCKH